ncbi:MAG: autotransporter domain-containing protein [Verrucomicrobia bacterium]|nr:autotransporter domain-containing protein [Verrucomicrobiota bacterium]
MKNLYLLTGILTASISAALASGPSPGPAPATAGPSFSNSAFSALHPNTPGARPDNAADRSNDLGISGAVDQFSDAPTTAGVKSKTVIPTAHGNLITLSGQYSYINTDDSRAFGSDLVTQSATIGGTAFINGNMFLGLNYTYSNATSGVNATGTSSHSDAHFVSLTAAMSLNQFLSIGVSGGYGNTDYTINTRTVGAVKGRANMDTWSISPYVSASIKSGRLISALTAAYQYETDSTTGAGFANNDDIGKFSIELRETFLASERLKVAVSAKFTDVLNGLGQSAFLPQSRTWATFGGKVSYQASKALEIYAGYSYVAFNQYLETHAINAGLKVTF